MATRKKDKTPASATQLPKATVPSDTPPTPAAGFPIVGIGASAGGLAAFEGFFSGMPANGEPGMAFVLVQHLAPDHKSILTDLVRRYTSMQVFEVTDGMVVQANCAYIIPPNRDMAFLNGALQLLEPSAPRGHRLPIDFLFNSLARDQRDRAIGIVLSGTGSDGSVGIRAIKAEGGMVMAQAPESTEFDGMPTSAIATGLVDYQLAPAEMAAQLIAYAAHAFGPYPRQGTVPAVKSENALKKVFILLRAQTGHDFSNYKPSTIHRRIERRMAVHQIVAADAYVRYLQQTPAEVEALFRDLLIGVTSFFRDPAAFEALQQQVIPKLFAGKGAGDAVRVWTTGCSTGEEAYSIAILLYERMQSLKQSFKVQVFATDIDSRAIATARAGLYPINIARDISPERLARFFSLEPDGLCYRINKSIRDMLVFSEQDVIKDPPFSKLDLISCRNLMIYMGAELQKKLIPLFHFTLNPGGMLFLGTSETVGEFGDLFSTLDHKNKIHQRREEFQGARRSGVGRMQPSLKDMEVAVAEASGKAKLPLKQSLRELTEQALLKQIAASAALVNGQGDILYVHGRTGMYLETAQGDVGISNVVKMARDGLRRDLTTALHKAVVTHALVQCPRLRVKTNGHYTTVNLTVRPVPSSPAAKPDAHLYLLVFEDVPAEPVDARLPLMATAGSLQADPSPVAGVGVAAQDGGFDRLAAGATIAVLNEELRSNREYLQAANEELETSNEELKSSNEEMQSVNEELQSTNEELETSKEELQSINEELATVNAELQTKLVDLSRASNDMSNLLASTGIGTVFVDHQLRILRYTPTATNIINLIPTDVGRPVAHTVSNLVAYDTLVADAQNVLDTLVPTEVEVQSTAGLWYSMRIQPYRTFDNVIEGAVITFVDITEIVRARESLREANELRRLAVVVRDAHDAISVQDLDGRITAWNPGATRLYGWTEAEALAMNTSERIPAELQVKALERVRQLKHDEVLEPCLTQRLAKAGTNMEVWLTSTALIGESGHMSAVATTERLKGAAAAKGSGGKDGQPD